MTTSSSIDWVALADSIKSEVIERRRDFHRHPELAFQETRTAGIVAQTLTELGLEVTAGVGKTGVVAVLEGAKEGATVLVRADMDALPVNEQTGVPHISTTPGKMHACGHDGHTAIGLGVAKLLSQHRDQLAGRVKFVFQPAEEIAQGALAMIKDGALHNPAPEVSFGLHLWNDLPTGVVSITEGPAMAGSGLFTLKIKGRGGHGAVPEQTHDPIVAGAQIVTALQTIVSRNVSGTDTAVVSVTTFHGGDAFNVIPNEVTLTGTVRTFLPEVYEKVDRRMHEIVTGIAAAMGCTAELETRQTTVPLINDVATSKRLQSVFPTLNFKEPIRFVNDVRTMGAEDMAFFLRDVPGTFFFVGSGQADGSSYPHHHPQFEIDEEALPVGVALLCAAVADRLM